MLQFVPERSTLRAGKAYSLIDIAAEHEDGQIVLQIVRGTNGQVYRKIDGQTDRWADEEWDSQATREQDRWQADLTQLIFFYLKFNIFGNDFFQMQLMKKWLQGLNLEQTDTIITNFPPQWDKTIFGYL